MNNLSISGVVLAGLLVGAGVGYWYGNMLGFEAGVASQQNLAVNKAAEEVNPFGQADTNPFDNASTNPYENIKTNPFE